MRIEKCIAFDCKKNLSEYEWKYQAGYIGLYFQTKILILPARCKRFRLRLCVPFDLHIGKLHVTIQHTTLLFSHTRNDVYGTGHANAGK